MFFGKWDWVYLLERVMFLVYLIFVIVYGGDDIRVVVVYCWFIIVICGSIDRCWVFFFFKEWGLRRVGYWIYDCGCGGGGELYNMKIRE